MTVAEKLASVAGQALQKSITPFVGGVATELSALIGDQIRFRRWKAAVRILDRAREFCSENGVKETAVPIKFLVPFLDVASLEEISKPNKLVDLWASLLASSASRKDTLAYLFIEKLRALSNKEAREISRFVDFLLKEIDPTKNLFREDHFDPEDWNTSDFEEFYHTTSKEIEEENFNVRYPLSLIHGDYGYEITPDIDKFLGKILKYPHRRDDVFIDKYGWEVFNKDGSFGGSSSQKKHRYLSYETIESMKYIGLIHSNNQIFRHADSQFNGFEIRIYIRLNSLSTLGNQFIRATHINSFKKFTSKYSE